MIEDAFVKEGDEDVALYSVRARGEAAKMFEQSQTHNSKSNAPKYTTEIGRGRAIDLRNAQQIEDPQSGRGASMGTADQVS